MRKAWLLVAVGMLAAAPALADRIDGQWCATDGRSVLIAGSRITTPGGQQATGDYRRHAFDYVIPEGEAGAGQAVAMRQLSEQRIMVATDGGPEEAWDRCQPTA